MPVTDVKEPISVIAGFKAGKILPLKIFWNGKKVKIKQVTGSWKINEGYYTVYYISCLGENDVYYEISFSTKTLVWCLEKLETI
ncbi:MAG: hypothetical protein N2440_06035 [Actinobacteria bacterium]|nr:hypothetical protein [Actinomycetota bacterium]